MTTSIHTEAITWWRTQPAPVRAILDLANTVDNADMVAAFLPGRETEVEEIGRLLVAIDELESGFPGALEQHVDEAVSVIHADDVASEIAEQYRADVLVMAQLIASLLPKAVAA